MSDRAPAAWTLRSAITGAPLALPVVAFLAGISTGQYVPPIPGWMVALATVIALGAGVTRKPALVLAGVSVATLMLGMWRFQASSMQPANGIQALNGQFVELVGVVSDEPDLRDNAALLRVRVEQVATGQRGQPAWRLSSGTVLVRAPLWPEHAYGDRLDVRGKLQPPPVLPNFDYRAYLARQGIFSELTYASITPIDQASVDPIHAAINLLRARIVSALNDALPEPEASLQRAILIGSRSATFSTLAPDFIRTGMIHIIATSGFKVAIVGGTLLEVGALLLGRRRAAYPALVLGACYILITGATPAGIRAGLMWAAALGALVTGRPAASFQGLLVAVGGMVAADPGVLGDSGFQMSAGATGGILLLMPRWERWLTRLPGWLAEPVGVTLAAQVGVLPVTMTGFQQVSFVAPLANLLCLPMLAASMAMGALTVLLATVAPGLGHLAGLPAFGFLALMMAIVRVLAALPFAFVAAPSVTSTFAALYYAGVLSLLPLWSVSYQRAGSGSILPWRLFALLGVAAGVPLIMATARRPAAMPTITVFAAGAGDSVLVQDLQGRSILIDTGSVARTTLAQLGGTLPFWQRRIDAVTLLGFEAGHAGALPEIASRYTLNAAVAPKAPSKPGTSDQTAEAALPANSLRIAPTDSILDKADRIPATGVSVELWSAGTAATPHVLARITADDATILDAASLSPTDQHRLLLEDVPLQASVLIAPGGATAAAFDPGFLLAVHPSYILAGAPPARASTAAPATDPYVYDPDVTVVRVDLSGPLQLVPEGDSFVLQ